MQKLCWCFRRCLTKPSQYNRLRSDIECCCYCTNIDINVWNNKASVNITAAEYLAKQQTSESATGILTKFLWNILAWKWGINLTPLFRKTACIGIWHLDNPVQYVLETIVGTTVNLLLWLFAAVLGFLFPRRVINCISILHRSYVIQMAGQHDLRPWQLAR